MIRLIASDMDGTLLNSKKEFDDEFFNILQELLNKEIYFVIASGNQFHHLYNQFLPYSDDLYFISENGSFITKGKKELYSFTMDQYDVQTIYDVLKQDKQLNLKKVVIEYDQQGIKQNFLYMLNCIQQLFVINTSKVVIIRDNNYVVSTFKREGVNVIQVWHACGAIKKFGNALARKYPIKNYDYVIANSSYWKKPYSEAFSVKEENVVVTGMPRVDCLFDDNYLKVSKNKLLAKYPMLKDKKIILYAPTFRGNIYQGFSMLPFDGEKLINSFDENTYLIYKLHPLLKNVCLPQHPRIIDMFNEDTHELFALSDLLISDFSSIVFDYSILNKTMYFYVPDLNDYLKDVGCYVNTDLFPGKICKNIDELIQGIQKNEVGNLEAFKNIFFEYQDGKNTKRVVELIYDILKKSL